VPSQALFAPGNPVPWITLTAWYLVYTVIEAYVIAPRVVGRTVNLRTVVVILVTLVGGVLAERQLFFVVERGNLRDWPDHEVLLTA
jgi:DMSO reductase anchor subunit